MLAAKVGVDEASLLSPDNPAHTALNAQHKLLDMSSLARVAADAEPVGKGRGRGHGARKRQRAGQDGQRGVCRYENCCISEPARSKYKCLQCRDGKGAFYHLDCFFSAHKATLK